MRLSPPVSHLSREICALMQPGNLTVLRPVVNITRLLWLNEQLLNSTQKQLHILVDERLKLNHTRHRKRASNRPPQPSMRLVVPRSEHCWLLLASEDWQHGLHHIRLSYRSLSVYIDSWCSFTTTTTTTITNTLHHQDHRTQIYLTFCISLWNPYIESIALGSEQLTRFGPMRTSEEPYFLCRTGMSSLNVRCQVVYRRQRLENFARKGPGTSLRPGRNALRKRETVVTARIP